MNQKTNYIDTYLEKLQKTQNELSKNTTEDTAHETANRGVSRWGGGKASGPLRAASKLRGAKAYGQVVKVV